MKLSKKAWILTSVLVFVTGLICARAQDSDTEKSIQMVAARASLSKGIDAKKAKQGDAVTARLDEAVKIPGSVELPKNTVLLGHIDQVQPSENKSDSSVQLTFDKAQLKNGQQMAIKATIMRIEPPPSLARNQDNVVNSSPMSGQTMPPTAGSTSGSSAGNPGGSSGGGMRSSPSSPTPAPVPSLPSSSGQSQQTQQSIPDIQLHSDIHESNSGVFTARKKNVHLDGGTEMQLAIAVIPPGTQVQ
ncbi:hypothetical protein [Alloacidobacterium sp.]|uniref:hypothetical protein n=1 Tax=Alloacidobacterium sp. TaxID=2951999 RepID=UPI002D489066|nr:hypothetical protein [Alloacidobacterium sp.]HYK37550.1 hypothetical protein [Alloacidobacterium sp.]